MTEFESNLISLIKSGLSGERCSISNSLDWEMVYKYAVRHHIVILCYYGIINSGIVLSKDIFDRFKSAAYKHIYISNNQLFEISRIKKAFDVEKISYCFLKGSILKSKYQKAELRYMGDADVLIRSEQYEKITEILKSMGYEYSHETDNHFVWNNKGKLMLELHTSPVSEYNKDFTRYYGDGWKFFDSDNSSYLIENHYVFIFAHFAKHYRNGGAGIKYINDLYVYNKAYPDMDNEYISSQLEKLGLLEFYRNVMKTVEVWFNKKTPDVVTDCITNRVFKSGAYGTADDHIISKQYKNTKAGETVFKGRAKKALQSVFPRYETVCKIYPITAKIPILLPFMWVYRWFEVLFTRRHHISKTFNSIKVLNNANVNSFKEELLLVGLDFND